MTDDQLLTEYKARRDAILMPLADRISEHLKDNLSWVPRIDRIGARAKSSDRFLTKAAKARDDGTRKYEYPFEQIQDLVGVRVIVFYLQDVEAVTAEIDRYYNRIEIKDLVPESLSEFGYVGKHFILAVPDDLIQDEHAAKTPKFFELQVKTLFQHAWSEAEHDLAYKPSEPLTQLQRRQVAFTAAQAWGADQLFSQLHGELGQDVSGASQPSV